MGFETGPIPITLAYQEEITNRVLMGARIPISGLFGKSGTFAIDKEVFHLGYDPRYLWARDLLSFDHVRDGIQVTRQGDLCVYDDKKTRGKGEWLDPKHVINPANIRVADRVHSFIGRVSESGWLISLAEVHHQQITDPQLTLAHLEKILIDAEAGKQPAHLDNHAQFVKVDPELAGTGVHVIKFHAVRDAVVVDMINRRLLERSVQYLLSQEKWQPETVVSNSQLK